MLGSTDIPDWCWTEAVGVPSSSSSPSPSAVDPRAADPTRIPVADAGALAAMAAASPIRYVGAGAVRAPTLLLVGAKDRRVPKEQALEYWYALKEAGVTTKCVPRRWRWWTVVGFVTAAVQ
jgi:acylaminoacyl-peptidase